MLCAFKIYDVEVEGTGGPMSQDELNSQMEEPPETVQEQENDDDIDLFDDWRVMERDLIEDVEEWMTSMADDFNNEVELDVEISEGINEWLGTVLPRNPCLAHLLQLAIKDSLKECPSISALIKKAQKILNFFGKSPKYTEMLRERTKGLSLLKIGITRWNSTYDGLNRLTSVTNQVNL